MIKFIVLLLVVVGCLAGAPTVNRNIDAFPQNGGQFRVTGSGFVQENIGQFDWILIAGGVEYHSNPNLRSTGPELPGAGDWFGCKPRTFKVNAAGTAVSCVMQWIPDTIVDAVSPVTLFLDVVNDNGPLTSGRVQVATITNVDERVFASTTNTVPNVLYGITVTGSGFPEFESLDVNADTFTLSLDDGTNTYTINILASLMDTTYNVYDGTSFVIDPAGFGTPVNRAHFTNINPQCTWSRTSIQCWHIPGGFDVTNPTTPNNVLFATVNIQSVDLSTGGDQIGPAGIANIIRDPPAPTLIGSAALYPWTADRLVLTGSGFVGFPSIQSNVIIFPTLGRGNEPRRCDPISVNDDGTSLTCVLFSSYNDDFTGSEALEAHVMVGDKWSFTTTTAPAITPTTVGIMDYEFPLPTIDPRSSNVGVDAQSLTISSGLASFAVDGLVGWDDTALTTTTAPLPSEIVTTVTLTGIDDATPITCQLQIPNWPDATDTATVPESGVKACTIDSMTPDRIKLNLPPITAEPGTTILAEITTEWISATGTATVTWPSTAVGVLAPGAGAGGDPHFVGILGKEYEFDGVAGVTYNMLSDPDVQINVEIGKMYFSKTDQTIMRKLGLKTKGGSRIEIDAGGNNLAAPGFSIKLNGRPMPQSRDRNATDDYLLLGTDGTARWYPLTQEEDIHLPLWEMHVGVAEADIWLENYHIKILSIEQGKDKNGNWHQQPVRFLDFMIDMFDPDRTPTGVFGQSAHPPPGKRKDFDWNYEGVAADYEVSDLFGDDFTFNEFGN